MLHSEKNGLKPQRPYLVKEFHLHKQNFKLSGTKKSSIKCAFANIFGSSVRGSGVIPN